jgi:hypothetical protein
MKRYGFFLALLFAAIFSWQTGRVETKGMQENSSIGSADSCIACHTNYQTLQTLASPDTEPPVEGCGGAAPHIEPHDRVFLGGPGYETFKDSAHGRLSCTACHGGVGGTPDKKLAHSEDFIKHPSLNAQAACGDCHGDIVKNAAGSLHEQGWGQKKSVAMRMGHSSFDHLPGTHQEAYGQNCATCHAGCGDCHVNRPKAAGGGLYKGHQFSRTPDMRDTCVACHSSRGGHAYFGLGVGAQPDVHLMQAGFTCLECHPQKQIHGDGRIHENRYRTSMGPQCRDCHDNTAGSNDYHKAHGQTFDCHVCHSQDYNNCGSCHVGGAGARIPSHLNFKIGLNPIPEDKPYRLALLRRTPAAPDNWAEYGTPQMPDFNAKPTFNYTTPHNILRWTTRTRVEEGRTCSDSCHVVQDGSGSRNRELYLFSSDLKESWEKSANKDIVVDGRLPASWKKP